MSACIDTVLGQMIHNYELGLLSEKEREKFEIHLLECDYCRALAGEFLDVSRILKQDPDVQAVVDDIMKDEDAEEMNSTKKSSNITRLLLTAAAVLVIALPLYKFVFHSDSSGINQTIVLSPVRSEVGTAIDLEKGGDVTINFFVADDYAGPANLVISMVGRDTILIVQDFTDFNEHGMGSITIPVNNFSKGHYMLDINSDTGSDIHINRQYMFRVK